MTAVARGSITHNLDIARSLLTSVLRAGSGMAARPAAERPPLPFELYEFEGCPYCRIVREVLTELDLDAVVHPCPKGGGRFRPRVLALGGRLQFPYLVDPNTGVAMYESADIVRYLFERYARRRLPLRWRWIELQQLGSSLAGIPRLGAGVRVSPSRPPEHPLELYSFESSPSARLVRERLSELELAYLLRSAGRSAAAEWLPPALRDAFGRKVQPATVNRRAVQARAGTVTIPFLVDPGTGAAVAGGAAIVTYLNQTYAL